MPGEDTDPGQDIKSRMEGIADTVGKLPGLEGVGEDLKSAVERTAWAKGEASDKRADILESLKAKKSELFKEIIGKNFKDPVSYKVGVNGADAELKTALKVKAALVASSLDTEFWNSASMKGLKATLEAAGNKFKKDEEIGNMFAKESMQKIRAANGNVKSLDDVAGARDMSFQMNWDLNKNEILIEDAAGKQAVAITPDQKKVQDGVAELKKGGGLLKFVLIFLCGVDPSKDENQQYAEIVSGSNYMGHMICGLFGFGFAKESIATVRGFIPESGQAAFDKVTTTLNGYREKAMGPAAAGAEGAKEVENFISQLSSPEAAAPLTEGKILKADETVPFGKDMLIIVPVGSSVKLNTSVGVKVREEGVGERVLTTGEEVATQAGRRILRISSDQVIGQGSVFGKGVIVAMASGKEGGSGDPYTEALSSNQADQAEKDQEAGLSDAAKKRKAEYRGKEVVGEGGKKT